MVVIFLIYFLFWVYITVSQSFILDSRERFYYPIGGSSKSEILND